MSPLVIAGATLVLACAPEARAAPAIDITPAEHAACDVDAARLCSAAFPDLGEVVSCMKAKRDLLTPVCLSAIQSGMKRRHLAM